MENSCRWKKSRTVCNEEMSIIIYSCWKNRDMWEIFSILFNKYWKDCPFKIVLVTDKYTEQNKRYVFDDIVVLDDTWGRMIKFAIERTATPYVMLWMDDYLICDYVSNDEVLRQLVRMQESNAVNLRLTESPRCQGAYRGSTAIGYYESGMAYSISTQVGIWNAELLKYSIKDEWSAWDFERIGSLKRIFYDSPILVSLDYEFPYEEGVRQGKWMEQGVKLCKRNGIVLDKRKRPIMSNWEMAKVYFKGAILDINPTLIVRLQNIIIHLKRTHR